MILKRAIKALLGRGIWISPRIRVRTEWHGSIYGGWRILENSLDANSVILSFGLGEDVSFDLSLIGKYRCVVHGFDPTPRSIDYLKNLDAPSLVRHEYGLSNRDGSVRLFLPENPAFVSASELEIAGHTSSRSFDAPVKRLSTILAELSLNRIDVLKMDIEGSEFAILEDAGEHPALMKAGQFLVEFHHMWRPVPARRTRRAIGILADLGFALAWVSDSSNEFLFVNEAAMWPPSGRQEA